MWYLSLNVDEARYKMTATLLLLLMFLEAAQASSARSSYTMDKSADCSFAGFLDVETDTTVQIIGKTSGASSSVMACTLQFRVADDRDHFDLSIGNFQMDDCDVVLFVSLEGTSTGSSSYTCGTPQPGSMMSSTGRATLRLERRNINSNNYAFTLNLRAYKLSAEQGYNENDSSPMAVGMVVGIVGGIVVFLVFLAILVVCCYRRKRQIEREEEYKQNLENHSNTTYGYDNDARNGDTTYNDTPGSNKKLLLSENDEYINKRGYKDNYKVDNEADSSNSSGERKAPLIESYSTSPKKSMSFDYDDVRKGMCPRRRNLLLMDLSLLFLVHCTVMLSSGQLLQLLKLKLTRELRGFPRTVLDKTLLLRHLLLMNQLPPTPEPKTILTTPRRRGSHRHLLFPLCQSHLNVSVQHLPASAELPGRRHLQRRSSRSNVVTLMTVISGSWGKSPKEKRKQGETGVKHPKYDAYDQESLAPESEKGRRPAGGFQKNSGLRKSSRKSPRIGRASRPSTGSILDDNESIGRPETPTSQISRFRDDDLDSNYQPLKRSASRQSLYASRSSLYGRRGRRERSSSIGESVMSYMHDDIDAYSDDDFDSRRVSRKESLRKGYRHYVRQVLRRGMVRLLLPRKELLGRLQPGNKVLPLQPPRNPEPRSLFQRMKKRKMNAPNLPPRKQKRNQQLINLNLSLNLNPLQGKALSAKNQPDREAAGDPVSHAQTGQPETPAFTAASGMPYPGQMVPGGPMPYPGQPHYIPPGGMPMMQPYPGAMMPGGQPVPPVMYAPVPRMPAAAAPPQHPPQAPPGQPGKSGKSSWDILCAITDHERNSDNTESASVTGSVFSHQQPQQPNPYSGVQYPPGGVQYPPGGVQYVPQGYAPPGTYMPQPYMQPPGAVSDYGSVVGSGQYPHSAASSSSSDSGGKIKFVPPPDKSFPRQASWEVLNDMAKSEKSGPKSNKTESIV
ncbi:uncharacterized protein LOC124290393 [Haliotis rubra]|uniref:uncharacterized protein LOC124290393 n=1 Tax=Haliotis rubra TaxID=36100 RepID=UPI001EE56EA9|nr:uncharacterized protein LOC124290393 [Haliotis rubra]